jgi:hypothetical protein
MCLAVQGVVSALSVLLVQPDVGSKLCVRCIRAQGIVQKQKRYGGRVLFSSSEAVAEPNKAGVLNNRSH